MQLQVHWALKLCSKEKGREIKTYENFALRCHMDLIFSLEHKFYECRVPGSSAMYKALIVLGTLAHLSHTAA